MPTGETFALLAPLSGPIVPIESVPDPVFSEKMVGDGIAIDPISQTLLAPCAAAVTKLHPSWHAITLTTAAGVEILMHIGLDTVRLKGKGFKARVREGDEVAAGQPLIDLDADLLIRSAPHLMTLIVITNGDAFAIIERASGAAKAGESRLMTVAPRQAAGAAPRASGVERAGAAAAGGEASATVVVPNPNGLHARPAAVLVKAAQGFAADVRFELAGRRANGKSLVALLGLDVGARAELRVVARGEDAARVVARLAELVEGGLGEDLSAAPTAPVAPAGAAPRPGGAPGASDDERRFHGTTAAPGLSIGPAFRLDPLAAKVEERGAEPDAERGRLREALQRSRRDLARLIAETGDRSERGKIFGAHLILLDDPETAGRAEGAIREGKSAAFAWREAVRWGAEQLAAVKSPLLAARASDLRDVGARVLAHLGGGEELAAPAGSVVLAEDLTPSEVIRLAEQQVAGLVSVLGGATSHAAILARSLGLPYLVGASPALRSVAAGRTAVLDADRAVLRLDPDVAELEAYRREIEARAALRAEQEARATERAATRDSVHVEVLANIAGAEDAREAVRLGADGVGLLRTELMFPGREAAPTEAEQVAAFEAITAALGERPLVIRTLDVGGDKPLPYLPMPAEPNPLLGLRGLRIGWLRPELMRDQLRAILTARCAGRRRILLPMASSVEEIREVRVVLDEERRRAGAPPVELGVMVEVPSAAIQADVFALEVDFFSIGTNDLAQYTLAMDRTHPELARRLDALHPAVLRLIDATVRAGSARGKPVGVCGALASDLEAIPALIGLGVTELSVAVRAIPEVKARVRGLDAGRCRELAKAALALGGAAEVRALLSRAAAG